MLAVSIVIIVITVVYRENTKPETKVAYTNNIEVDGGGANASGLFTNADTYQRDLLNTIAEQNIVAFEKISNSFKKSASDTLSDTIAKDVFGEYLKYNTAGDFDQKSIQAAVAKSVTSQTPDIKLTSKAQLTVVDASLRNLDLYTVRMSETQFVISKRIVATRGKKDPTLYVKNIYAAAAKLFTGIPVPSSLVDSHLQLIHGFEYYVQGFELMGLQSSDPAKALLGVQSAQKGNELSLAGITEIKRVINLNNIVYNKEDPAYAWLLDVATDQKIKTK